MSSFQKKCGCDRIICHLKNGNFCSWNASKARQCQHYVEHKQIQSIEYACQVRDAFEILFTYFFFFFFFFENASRTQNSTVHNRHCVSFAQIYLSKEYFVQTLAIPNMSETKEEEEEKMTGKTNRLVLRRQKKLLLCALFLRDSAIMLGYL